jgi:hypothetical protein
MNILHNDHGLTSTITDFLASELGSEAGFFIRVLALPEGETLPAGLYGPAEGDSPVDETEVSYVLRGGRPCASRVVNRPSRAGSFVVCIGIADAEGITLFTAYGSVRGVVAPREPGDQSLDSWELVQESRSFWAQHALTA